MSPQRIRVQGTPSARSPVVAPPTTRTPASEYQSTRHNPEVETASNIAARRYLPFRPLGPQVRRPCGFAPSESTATLSSTTWRRRARWAFSTSIPPPVAAQSHSALARSTATAPSPLECTECSGSAPSTSTSAPTTPRGPHPVSDRPRPPQVDRTLIIDIDEVRSTWPHIGTWTDLEAFELRPGLVNPLTPLRP